MAVKATLSKDGKKLSLEIDLSAEPKETPKMYLVGNTGGFTDVEGVKIGENALRANVMVGYRKPK